MGKKNYKRKARVSVGVSTSAGRSIGHTIHNFSMIGIVVSGSWGHSRNLIVRAITSQYRKIKGDVS